MKFIVSSSVLLKNLSALSGVISSSNTLPILDDFLFELKEDQLFVTASDLETTMTVTIPLTKAEEPGSVTIPAKLLLDTLKTFSDIPVIFSINPETLLVELSAGEGKYKLSGHSSDEFPQSPVLEATSVLTVHSGVLVDAINKTLFATGSDELRPVMSGVYCELSPEHLTFVATDAHKLVRYRRMDAHSDQVSSFILPKKPLNQIKGILAGKDLEVNIEYSQTNSMFTFDSFKIICRLIEGKYPNYEAVIPTNNPNVLTVDRGLLLNAIRRVALFANQSTHQIRFKISGKELVLSAEDIDFSNEAKERLTCSYEGEDMEIGFNSRFLQDMVTNVSSEQVKFEMSAPNRAGLIMPVENENLEEEILMLVMPVMLN
ncbi:MAG TPA: DNA polymerase III subunit beta [Bacteroidales bacterium]|nr:DNA polymerase III subunit beta [Bacteroidales bacterium]HNQ83186.1 DNA polymerase III subunit beta [Bacteroidales bacterium]HOX78991.1 DNA polymerase III subunit beta [Bacteroidales bacterium]HPI87240.1 DNA polymerase III subunit beta [Bacteroidales bacterium]HPM91644.1 DNA polymerase III subunit beta [Bacteroidales bacterium]